MLCSFKHTNYYKSSQVLHYTACWRRIWNDLQLVREHKLLVLGQKFISVLTEGRTPVCRGSPLWNLHAIRWHGSVYICKGTPTPYVSMQLHMEAKRNARLGYNMMIIQKVNVISLKIWRNKPQRSYSSGTKTKWRGKKCAGGAAYGRLTESEWWIKFPTMSKHPDILEKTTISFHAYLISTAVQPFRIITCRPLLYTTMYKHCPKQHPWHKEILKYPSFPIFLVILESFESKVFVYFACFFRP